MSNRLNGLGSTSKDIQGGHTNPESVTLAGGCHDMWKQKHCCFCLSVWKRSQPAQWNTHWKPALKKQSQTRRETGTQPVYWTTKWKKKWNGMKHVMKNTVKNKAVHSCWEDEGFSQTCVHDLHPPNFPLSCSWRISSIFHMRLCIAFNLFFMLLSNPLVLRWFAPLVWHAHHQCNKQGEKQKKIDIHMFFTLPP